MYNLTSLVVIGLIISHPIVFCILYFVELLSETWFIRMVNNLIKHRMFSDIWYVVKTKWPKGMKMEWIVNKIGYR